MGTLRQSLDRYYGAFRKFKFGYTLLNLFNRKKLRHAEAMYKKYELLPHLAVMSRTACAAV